MADPGSSVLALVGDALDPDRDPFERSTEDLQRLARIVSELMALHPLRGCEDISPCTSSTTPMCLACRDRALRERLDGIARGACCERDHDNDGNCDRHPGVVGRIARGEEVPSER